ncbi:MAG: nuclear transport factor 2 family protein [Actinomycetota bacterium]
MSEENVQIVRSAFAAFNRGDLSGVLEPLSDDLVTYRAAPFGDSHHGPDGFLEATMDWIEGFAEWSVTPEEFIDAGDRVVVRSVQEGCGEESGAPVTGVFWFVHALRQGKIVRIDIFAEEAAALEGAGIKE